MKKPTIPRAIRVLALIPFLALGIGLSAQTVFINEIHYDDAGADSGEGIEVAGPAGTDLTGWTLYLYNGSNGTEYDDFGFPGSIPDLGGGYGTVFVSTSGIQNGGPDGIVLYDGTSVVQFLSYEGAFLGVGGVADGITSTDIGQSETSSTLDGTSLQLTGTGTVYTDFTWAASAASTYDAFNNGQTFGGAACGISLDPEIAVCNTVTSGPGDTYDLSIPYTGMEGGTAVVNNGASGTISGDDPAVVANGTVVISGIDEADSYNVTFTAPCDAFSVSGSAPICEPIPTTALVVNEILADPDATLGDANGDGVVDTSDDEFVELVNSGGVAEDISDWTLSDGTSERHVFPLGTVVPAGCAIVVFGGGTPTGLFGGAVVQVATGGYIGMNNGGDDIILKDPLGQVVFTVTYGAAGTDQSLNLDPEITGVAYLEHSTIPAAAGALFSPGTLVDGSTFSGCTLPACAITLGAESTNCITFTSGTTDTYDLSIPYTGMQAGTSVINNSGSGSIGGDDPAVVANGTIVISGISEADNYNLAFSTPCAALTVSGTAPSCDPPPCALVLDPESAVCNSITEGPTDTYDLSIPYTGMQAGTSVINNSGSGSIGGDDPAVVANGTIVISGISESDAYDVAFDVPCETLTVSGAAPDCEPVPTLTIINFDAAANWAAGSAGLGSYASDHQYAQSDWDFTGGPALRATTGDQDGFPSALDVYSWRLQNLTSTDWQATYNGTETLTQFGFDVRRWDASPSPNFAVSYSTDGGSNFSAAVLTIDNTFLDDLSDWKTFSYTIPAPAQYAPGNFIVRVASVGTTERIFIDNFSFDTGAVACALSLGTPMATCDSFTAGPGNDTYTVAITYTGVQAGATVINTSGSGSISGDDPSTVTNGTITVSGITEGTGYSITFAVPCETLVISGASPACEPPPTLVINEIDYDETGTDFNEFVEIKNTGASPVDLGGLKLVLMNGGTGSPYDTYILNSVMLAAGDYYVVGSSTVPNVDQVEWVSNGIQNGDPDGVRLTTADDLVIDQMSYEGDMPSSTEGTGAGTDPGDGIGASLARFPDGVDTDDNSVDFILTCSTPGAANSFPDADNDGTPDCVDECPGGPEPGSTCDDGDAQTADDVIQNDCSCAGTPVDCEGEPDGPALPGTMCDDGNPGTINDVYQLDCTCAGLVPDCLGIPGGPNLPGAPCDDNIASTNDETYDDFCQCVGTPCSQNVTLELRSDALSSQIGWEILYANDNTVVCSGGTLGAPYMDGITAPITEPCCLPIGCFRLRVTDSGGDGFVSGGITGGYVLRESGVNGRRIIDNSNNFNGVYDGSVSAISDDQPFCMPMGDDQPIFSSCDKLDWVTNKFIVATENAAVTAAYATPALRNSSGYVFWFFDPNGSYSFRRFRKHSESDGYGTGALRANHFRVNAWVNTPSSPHLPEGVLLNVRIMGRVNWSWTTWGPACQFKMDAALAACPRVNLQDNPALNEYSCGVNRVFGGSNHWTNRVTASQPQPVPGVSSSLVRYQFRFRIPGEEVCIVRPPQTSPRLYMNWSATSGPQLECGKQYEVDVRVSLDGGANWCFDVTSPACVEPVTTWGKVCVVNITTSTYCPGELQGGSSSMATDHSTSSGSVTMYPNPNRGDQLYINLSAVDADVHTVSVDIYDLTGKRISARTVAVQDGFLNTVMDLSRIPSNSGAAGGEIASGIYMINITAGDKTYTERLVIQR
ncbi:MAG: lamin tail domain-containing protein [Flavobacteriales bacterium]|nr:lamin tail domain-containing protein [Flavobacteriales bacterium]